MQHAAELAAELHMEDLTDQLADTRRRHQITQQILDRHLCVPVGTTRQRELGLYAALPLTAFTAWSRALAVTIHLTDQYGRVLPAWMWHRPPHETNAAFENRRLARTLDLRRDAIPCDLPVLTDHLGITATAWQDWNAGTACPDLLTAIRACVALDVRIALIPQWHEDALGDLRVMQADSQSNSTTARTGV